MKLKFNFYLGWLGGRKAKGSIDVAQVVKLLHSNGATADVLQVFLNLVDPLEERENIAKKFGVHTIVVDVCVLNRDRIALGKKHALKKYDQFNLNTIHAVLPPISFAAAIGKLTHFCHSKNGKSGKAETQKQTFFWGFSKV